MHISCFFLDVIRFCLRANFQCARLPEPEVEKILSGAQSQKAALKVTLALISTKLLDIARPIGPDFYTFR